MKEWNLISSDSRAIKAFTWGIRESVINVQVLKSVICLPEEKHGNKSSNLIQLTGSSYCLILWTQNQKWSSNHYSWSVYHHSAESQLIFLHKFISQTKSSSYSHCIYKPHGGFMWFVLYGNSSVPRTWAHQLTGSADAVVCTKLL